MALTTEQAINILDQMSARAHGTRGDHAAVVEAVALLRSLSTAVKDNTDDGGHFPIEPETGVMSGAPRQGDRRPETDTNGQTD